MLLNDLHAVVNINVEFLGYSVGLFDQLYFDWERSDGGAMPSDYDTRDGNLYINDVRREDAGRYRCVGRNRQGQEVLTVNARLEVVGSKSQFGTFDLLLP